MAKQENRVELKGSVRTLASGAREVGPADPDEQIEVSVYLRRGSDRAEFPSVEEIGSQLPRERRHLSREAFATAHGARAADIEKVRAFALRYGLLVVGEDRARRSLRLRGSVQAFKDAFGVKLSRCEHPSGTYRARTGTISIPSDLDGIIEGVFGLDNRPQAKPHFRVRQTGPALSPFPIRRFKSRRPTTSPAVPTAAGNASESWNWAAGIPPKV